MNNSLDTEAEMTVSGMIGCFVKTVFVKPVLIVISFGSLANVILYADASVGIGFYETRRNSIEKLY